MEIAPTPPGHGTIWFGASYYPNHYDPTEWPRDLDTMVRAGINAVRVGDFSWTRLEPREGEYTFAWLDDWLTLAASKGIGTLVIPPLRCPPAWLLQAHPDIAIINENGVAQAFGSRYTYCINHPELRARGLALAATMAKRYAGHEGVLGWHLDNEYGDEADCHCANCQQAWVRWLKESYGTAAALNRAWGNVFWNLEVDALEQVSTPRTTRTYYSPAHLLAWRQFRSDCTVQLINEHAAVVRKADPAHLVTTNLQCLHNARTDYFALRPSLDVLGVNYYPPYGNNYATNSLGLAAVRGVARQNFQVHELRNAPHAVPGRPNNTPLLGEIERLTMHCIGHGADAIFFFQWRGVPFGAEQTHGTPTGYDGEPTRVFHEVARLGRRLQALGPALAGSEVHSDVAVLYDFPTRWGMSGGEEWCGPANLYIEHSKRVYEAIRGLGVNCDACGRDADWSGYAVLVVPMLDCLDAHILERLAAYVESGGVLVWHPQSGVRNRDGEMFPRRLHATLEETLGITARDFGTAGPDEEIPFMWRHKRYTGRLFYDLLCPATAHGQGNLQLESLEDYPAVTENRYGKGTAYTIATFAGVDFYADFLREIFSNFGVVPILGHEPPRGVEVIERSNVSGACFVFVINRTREEQCVVHSRVWRDVESGETYKDPVLLGPSEVRILQVVPRL